MNETLQEFMSSISTISGAMATVIAALIAAYCAIRISKIDNRDRIFRSVWAFEQYIMGLSLYAENQTVENKANYSSVYSLFYFYSGPLRQDIEKIHKLVIAKKFSKVESAKFNLINKYCQIYNMKKFEPKKQ